jgi:hypothetical protein
LTSPNAGDVSITEGPITQTPPPGFSFLTQQIDISVTAPAATAEHPLVLTFMLDASRVEGLSTSDIERWPREQRRQWRFHLHLGHRWPRLRNRRRRE